MAAAPPCAFASPGRRPLAEPRPGVARYLVAPAQVGRRLDQAVSALSGLSRRSTRALAEQGNVWLNGQTARVLSRAVHLADVVDIIQAVGDPPCGSPPAPGSEFLYRDSWLVAVNKPAGVASQPPRRRAPGELTMDERIALELAWEAGHRVQVSLIHRLDRLTTGVMVFACNPEATRGLAAAWREGRVRKTYLAVVNGRPPAAATTLTGPVAPDPAIPGRFRVGRAGRPAATRVRTLATWADFALVAASPQTGRTHQVRVHLAEAGYPVAGDRAYGGGRGVPRPFLHSYRLDLPHPHTGRPLQVRAPLPLDLASLLAAAGVEVDGLDRLLAGRA